MSELAVFPNPFFRNMKQECRALMPNNVSYSQGVNQQIFYYGLGGYPQPYLSIPPTSQRR